MQRLVCHSIVAAGYFDVPVSTLATDPLYMRLIERLGAVIRRLVEKGWPASFVVVYDEAWLLVQLLSHLMLSTTGGNACMMDLVAWHIDPHCGEAGFTPHRDRHLGLREQDTAAVQAGFRHADGKSPRDSTCWIALSECSPDNGCLYMLPRCADPAYTLGDCSTAAATRHTDDSFALLPGPMKQAVYVPLTPSAWRHVRAVPCSAGSIVLFSHRTVHWGSQGRTGSRRGPRISFSFAGSDHAFKVTALAPLPLGGLSLPL